MKLVPSLDMDSVTVPSFAVPSLTSLTAPLFAVDGVGAAVGELLPTRRNIGRVVGDAIAWTTTQLSPWRADEVDDWGRDNDSANRAWTTSRLRWDVGVGGSEYVPDEAGALIVVNARRYSLAPVFAALAIGAATTRPVRFVGRTDLAPLGPFLQRLGALQTIPDEVEGALRADQLVVVGADPTRTNHRSGPIDPLMIRAALAAGVSILPTAAASSPVRRSARVEIGAPAKLRTRRRGPLAEYELAEVVQARIDALLAEFATTLTGTPFDLLTLPAELLR